MQKLLLLRACWDYDFEWNDDYEKAQGEVGQEVLSELLLLQALCVAGCWNFNHNVEEGQNEDIGVRPAHCDACDYDCDCDDDFEET